MSIVIALVILKMPELWQTIQAVINLESKGVSDTVARRLSVARMSESSPISVLYSKRCDVQPFVAENRR